MNREQKSNTRLPRSRIKRRASSNCARQQAWLRRSQSGREGVTYDMRELAATKINWSAHGATKGGRCKNIIYCQSSILLCFGLKFFNCSMQNTYRHVKVRLYWTQEIGARPEDASPRDVSSPSRSAWTTRACNFPANVMGCSHCYPICAVKPPNFQAEPQQV